MPLGDRASHVSDQFGLAQKRAGDEEARSDVPRRERVEDERRAFAEVAAGEDQGDALLGRVAADGRALRIRPRGA
jgi:hypothetical protein